MGPFAYESRGDRPLTRRHFYRRIALHAAFALLLFWGSLALGIWGYGHFEGLAWPDGFLNSAMLLGGMGPVNAPQTEAGKLFAGCYALFAGLVFIVIAGLLLAPVVHRVLHTFHWEQ
jgi:hypothetical protein